MALAFSYSMFWCCCKEAIELNNDELAPRNGKVLFSIYNAMRGSKQTAKVHRATRVDYDSFI